MVNTEKQAREILNHYKFMEGSDIPDFLLAITPESAKAKWGEVRVKVGQLVSNDPVYGFGFVCWPYSDKTPVKKDYAFLYGVSPSGDVSSASLPYPKDEARKLYDETFGREQTKRPVFVRPSIPARQKLAYA